MKYGQRLEHESVPEWSVRKLHESSCCMADAASTAPGAFPTHHLPNTSTLTYEVHFTLTLLLLCAPSSDNLDYNSLKHEIKVYTTHDQATAITIPGRQDTALQNFEDGLYTELCCQHYRIDLFITSKAGEISRRLEHFATKTQRWVAKYSDGDADSLSLKRQRRFTKYEREVLRCGEEIQALSRFANAQVVGFRKILKKHKKWTGSKMLSSRFSEIVLNNAKSFTKRTFEHLHNRHDEILADLQAATPHFSKRSSPESIEPVMPESPGSPNPRQVDFEPLSPSQMDSSVKYWNEYDNGSERGGLEGVYVIYTSPTGDTGFPGFCDGITARTKSIVAWIKRLITRGEGDS
ncbi:SPX domain-containing protein [Pochonia chlamydosporia 170]|uniref:SPX domain-containing protein n=1 Tax=Pochonia chlamydosporia 170 TaxID=1380566 RepID=A0A179FI26_METCM|nr:SPX domain-containing protein [Pochonia chlamydosporia 170]OAQ65204.1 SPX domain-containing protein [Pochonia chlamydosporia 170]